MATDYHYTDDNNYFINIGGNVGDYGGMPLEFMLRKMEVTPGSTIFDMSIDSHNRNVLMDRTPDSPLFADESPHRESQAESSHGAINLRYDGGRSIETPLMPEAFLGFTDRDERGYRIDPDLAKAIPESYARVPYIDVLTKDPVLSEESGERSELKAILDMRKAGLDLSRDRVQVFATSVDNYDISMSKVAPKFQDVGLAEKQMFGTEVTSIIHTDNPRRFNLTDVMSNIVSSGARGVPDHKIPVARYSHVPGSKKYENIRKAFDDSLIADEMIPRIDPELAIAKARVMKDNIRKSTDKAEMTTIPASSISTKTVKSTMPTQFDMRNKTQQSQEMKEKMTVSSNPTMSVFISNPTKTNRKSVHSITYASDKSNQNFTVSKLFNTMNTRKSVETVVPKYTTIESVGRSSGSITSFDSKKQHKNVVTAVQRKESTESKTVTTNLMQLYKGINKSNVISTDGLSSTDNFTQWFPGSRTYDDKGKVNYRGDYGISGIKDDLI